MTSRGHVPQRKCAGCGRRAAKKALVRFTLGRGGAGNLVIIDPEGRAGGRGVYVCRSLECYNEATGKRKSFQRSFGGAGFDEELRKRFESLIRVG